MIRLFLILVLFCILPSTLPAAEREDTFDLSAFAALPVLDQGRIKPLDSFARIYLKKISGKETYAGQSAALWLARTLFDPAGATGDTIFKITRPALFDLPAQPGNRYDFTTVAEILSGRHETIEQLANRPAQDWTPDQQALMALSDNALIYTQLLRSFSSVLPLNVEMPAPLAAAWKIKSGHPFSLKDIEPYIPDLKKRVDRLIRAKGDRIDRYTDAEQALAGFAYQIQLLERAGAANAFLKIIPPESGEDWLSPWVARAQGHGNKDLERFARMAQAWQENNASVWQAQADEALNSALSIAGVSSSRLTAERLYHAASPFASAMSFYLLTFLLLIGYRLHSARKWRQAAFAVLCSGALIHTAGLALRIYILARPPVGTLYESILFVSLIGALISIWLEHRLKNGSGAMAGIISGGLLLAIATAFSDDDSFTMLTAVLNTNFWLTVHVLCITIGYGFCLMTGVMAHNHLLRQFWHPLPQTEIRSLAKNVKTLALVSLLFTAVGTALGGIWADQSWGRFWGWDPKENGALLIVLWLSWAIHGRIGSHLSINTWMAAMAFLNVIVALAWFGVNLLGTGLHSYGFIEGVSLGLAAFCITEMAIIGWLWRCAERMAIERTPE
jgi:ABC-type transport system involved in cytochrome c biogenesis permease subunit